MMNRLVAQSKTKLFMLKLPEKHSKDIPESMIGQQMRNKLSQLVPKLNEKESDDNNDNNENNENNENNKNNNKLICDIIMESFRKLYFKYIDSNRAVFMINISSRNRYTLRNIFHLNNGKKFKDNDKMIVNSNDNQIEDLLKQIIIGFEPSVVEIAALMGDSFARFRIKEKELYQQLCLIVYASDKKN